MPAKQSQRAEVNSFVQGLITEASPLNFPGNASADEENFELNRDGTRRRRFGMDFESITGFRDTGLTKEQLDTAGISNYKWIEVIGRPELEFLVIQFNRKLFFYDLTQTITSEGYIGEVELTSFPDNTRYSFASIEGFLVVVAGVDSIAKVEYNGTSFSVSYNRILVRDVWGIQESDSRYDTDPSFRGGLDFKHKYNLQNQSWGVPKVIPSVGIADIVQSYFASYGVAPSNSEQIWPGLQFAPVGAAGSGSVPTELVYMNLYGEVLGSTPEAAKGYFIIDALRRGQSRAEKVAANNAKYPSLLGYSTAFPSDYTPGGASVVAEFAGRVFYSGFKGEVIGGDNRSPNLSNYVFFSQLVKNGNDISKCYQEGDPTSRDTPDIVDTDGGFLRISEAKNIIALVNLGASLVAIASNGVWLIEGGSDYGFSASNYKVAKISTFGGLSLTSVVSEGDSAYYWADDGIYSIAKDQFGDYNVKSLTMTTIQSFYEDIPINAKSKCFGVYDNSAKKLKWLYSPNGLSDSSSTFELVFDVSLGAFYKHRIRNLETIFATVLCPFQTTPFSSTSVTDFVFAGSDLVFSDTDEVYLDEELVDLSGILATKYVAIKENTGTIEFGFALYNNSDFLDWESVDNVGIDAKGYCLTGSQTLGDSAVNKQVTYLFMHFAKTEDSLDSNLELENKSSCLIRMQWNFATSVNSKQWTPLMQAYRYRKAYLEIEDNGAFDNGYDIVTSKSKVRGKGRAFALYFETEPKKDCRVLGWNLTITGNPNT